jgi:hypothetical protein
MVPAILRKIVLTLLQGDKSMDPHSASSIKINSDSWTITLFKKQRRLQFETLDYHAGPLMLTRDELIDIARKMGLHVRARKRKKSSSTT